MTSSERSLHPCEVDPDSEGFCNRGLVELQMFGSDAVTNPELEEKCKRCAFIIIRTIADPRTYWALLSEGIPETIVNNPISRRIPRAIAQTLRLPQAPDDHPRPTG